MASAHRPRGRPRNAAGSSANTIQALDRALDVLNLLASAAGLTLTEICSRLSQSPATMHRVLASLEARRMVEIDPATQTWHIGSGAFGVGSAFLRRTNLIDRARPVMHRMMETTGETCNLGIERDGAVVFISQVETHQSIRAFFPPGTRSHIHASGIGKAILANLRPDQLDRMLARVQFKVFTPHTFVDAESLRRELDLTRMRGFAVDDQEHTLGMRCVAAAIRNHHGEAFAGISVSGPVQRMDGERLSAIGVEVAQSAKELSRMLGGDAI